jgi:hypothetical protein
MLLWWFSHTTLLLAFIGCIIAIYWWHRAKSRRLITEDIDNLNLHQYQNNLFVEKLPYPVKWALGRALFLVCKTHKRYGCLDKVLTTFRSPLFFTIVFVLTCFQQLSFGGRELTTK